MMSDDMTLVREYAQSNSEQAFATLVSQHINLVYSVALRQVHDPHLAEEITQAVFIVLARKAKSLSPKTILSGWLCRTARNVSANTLKIQRRRQFREQESHMQSILNESDSDAWSQIAPLLDEALNCLGEKEHDAVVLRFFDGKELKQVGAAMGTTEDAARMRVNRGVEKLRDFFTRKGVTLSATAITGAVAASSVQAAPAGLAAAITTAALSGTTITTTAVIAATKAIAMTTLQKTIVASAVAVLVGAGVYEARQAASARAEVQPLQQQQTSLTEQIQQLQRERDDATNRLAQIGERNGLAEREKGELLRLRGELTRSKAGLQELGFLKAALLQRASDPTEMAITNWAARTLEFQKRIAQMPEAQIPEFAFLTPNDWLDISKDASLETDNDLRNAAEMLGANAKNTFAKLMKDALNKFLEANAGELPSEMSQLRTFFPVPVEDGVLQRYELLQSGSVKDVAESDRMLRLVGEKRFAPVGSGRPIVLIGTGGFIRTGQ
jgi:RNA polymerase sigma factor (sigma-70 family)